ncbi:EAL domain-containing protein [Halomonas sp. ZH2S]|uniref:EAL domain-containing protein n=1 Tax=Vreelandella zhuhanensis TaxID=2684210 RepID=A0A7X3H2B7_9GAMM|nr:EAL domain-containing protein [Halomonas zhuhanensis]MWJ29237.1 EAL domain-containing protein [Halomonas zhuhanensis]
MNFIQKHLLVVDDNPVNVELMLDLLDDHGFENVTGLSDPRQVLAHCERQLPALILLDIRMPHLDGYMVIEQLQQRFCSQTPPVIVLTAQIDHSTRRRALEMGVRDFLTKPFQHDEVLQRIRNTLRIENRYHERDQQAETLEHIVAKRTQALDEQTRTDPITELPNRHGLNRKLNEIRLANTGAGVLFLALDGYDDVIRLHGYPIAEKLLHHLGKRLQETLDKRHVLGIWGGSELLVISPSSIQGELPALAAQLLSCFDHDQEVEGFLLPLGARIGISAAEGIFDSERLVQMAALSLPNSPHIRVQCHSENLEARQRRHLHLQQAIRHAAERNELSLVFQPKLTLNSKRVIGAEALLRWEHPELGQISPGVFIPLTEASGDILAIGNWVLENAMSQAVAWRRDGVLDGEFNIAVNVAARQLSRKDFADQVLQRLERYRLPARFISLEVTESGLMSDINHARQQLAKLAEAGIAVAIDDFGTGHSSLAYLKTLPVSTLKIDRAFVMDLEKSPADRRLAEVITQLAHGYNCEVVAEGIEEDAQADLLLGMGCEIGQGFLYSRPLPAEEFVAWCDTWQAERIISVTESLDGPRPA